MIGFVIPCSYENRINILRICKFFLNKRDIKKAIANEFAACELIKEYNPPQFLIPFQTRLPLKVQK